MRKKCTNYQNLEDRLVWRLSASKMIQCGLNRLGKESVQLDLEDEKLGRKEMYPRATIQVQRQISSPYHWLPIPAIADKRLLCCPSVNSILPRYSKAQGAWSCRETPWLDHPWAWHAATQRSVSQLSFWHQVRAMCINPTSQGCHRRTSEAPESLHSRIGINHLYLEADSPVLILCVVGAL